LAVLILLFIARPDLTIALKNPRAEILRALAPAAFGVGATVLFSVLLLGTLYVCFGSIPAATAYFRGERITIWPLIVHLDPGKKDDVQNVTIEVYNWTASPVRLIGGSFDCACSVVEDLPVEIPAQESRAVRISVQLAANPGGFVRRADFLVDDHGLKRVNFTLTGRILAGD
jgi:hypothetical protein